MIRNLTRQLAQLESRIQPVVGKPEILTIQFVDKDRKVVDRMEITLAPPLLNDPGVRLWQRR